jgi:serine/threonine protein kinase
MAKQMHGLAGALAYIHDPPPESYPSGRRIHGRHGDIKPDNILLFAEEYERGTLVIADLGLTEVSSHASRKQVVSNKGMPACCLRYRPPEFDMRGGIVSSDCDIWSFGCVLFEWVMQVLQGWEARATLSKGLDGVGVPWGEGGFFAVEKRTAGVIESEKNESAEEDDGWTVMKDKKKQRKGRGKNSHLFSVHETVTQKFAELHASPDCTPFFHELLFLVEERMLIVRPRLEEERISAADLTKRLEEMLAKVLRTGSDYCKPAPEPRKARTFDKVEAMPRVQESGMCLAQ